jgi:hypothetical protein
MAQLDFGAIEAAIAAWLGNATGLSTVNDPTTNATARIIPKNDKVPQPGMPYMTFKVPVPRQAGGGPDEIVWSYDNTQPLNQEIFETVRGHREFVVSVQAFTLATVGKTDINGNLTARDYVSRCQTALALPSVKAAFTAAGMVFVDIANAADFTERLGPVGQGRATLDVRFRVVDTVSDQVGYIASTDAVTGGTLS